MTITVGGALRIASQLLTLEDPLPGFSFYVTLTPADPHLPLVQQLLIPVMALGAFSEVKGLGGELEVTPYGEGGVNDYVHQLPVRHSWGRITLRRGVIRDMALWMWYRAGLHGSLGARRSGAITVCDEEGSPAVIYMFKRASATKWIGPDLNGMQSACAIDGIEMAHEGIEAIPVPGTGMAQRIASSIKAAF